MSGRDCGNCKHYADDWAGASNPSGYGKCQRVMPHTRTSDGKVCGQHEYAQDITAAVVEAKADPHAIARRALEWAIREIDTCGDGVVANALGQQICCSGYHCGCQGADVGAYLTAAIRAIINDPAKLAEIVEGRG
jgi:hypothetical protein